MGDNSKMKEKMSLFNSSAVSDDPTTGGGGKVSPEKQAMVTTADGHTVIRGLDCTKPLPGGKPESKTERGGEVVVRGGKACKMKACRITPQRLVICVLVFVILLALAGLIFGLANREPRTRTKSKHVDKSRDMMTSQTSPPPWYERPHTNTPTVYDPHDPDNYRLPRNVMPTDYDLFLHPVLGPDQFYFTGSVLIRLSVRERTDLIVLHAKLDDVIVESLRAARSDGTRNSLHIPTNETGESLPIMDVSMDERRDFLYVHVGDQGLIENQIYYLNCTFSSELHTNFIGIYYDSYIDVYDNRKYFLASQLESVFARRVLPCFDEPVFKARFKVTIQHSSHHKAISNMPVLHTNVTSDRDNTTVFQRSAVMSTYLLAFAVGDFYDEQISNPVALNVSQRVWMQNLDFLRTSTYAQHLIKEQLQYFQQYFNSSYSLPKLDHIGIPAKGKGAMENWGLITYGEGYLITTQSADPQDKMDSASVIAHELSHQWFGNVVTMEWWDDLWLNEGFARCMEYVGVDHVEPAWKYWEMFLYQTLNPALRLDSLRSSREIRPYTATNNDIASNFDIITYLKGGSVVRMMMDFLGWETFRRGIGIYLSRFSYNNTVSDDLWEVLAEETEHSSSGGRIDVKSVMHGWTLQKNYPLVTIHRQYTPFQGGEGTGRIDFMQTRFLMDMGSPNVTSLGNDDREYVWDIPVSYTHESSREYTRPSRLWMHRENKTIQNTEVMSDRWMIANINATGFYRVNYDERNWRMLIDQLIEDHTVITTMNRAQLIDDALNLARAGVLNQSLALDTTRYLSREEDVVPWKTINILWETYYKILCNTRIYGLYKSYMISLLGPIYQRLGWQSEGSDRKRLLRTQIISLACRFGHSACVSAANTRFNAWLHDDSVVIDPPVRATVLCTGIANSDTSAWETVWQRMQETLDPSTRDTYRDALACSTQPWILDKYLSMSMNRTLLHASEVAWVVIAAARNPVGKTQAWEFLKRNWRNTGSDALQGKTFIAEEAMDSFHTDEDLQKMLAFKEDYADSHGYAHRYVNAAVERTIVNHRWMQSTMDEMERWFYMRTADINAG